MWWGGRIGKIWWLQDAGAAEPQHPCTLRPAPSTKADAVLISVTPTPSPAPLKLLALGVVIELAVGEMSPGSPEPAFAPRR